MNLCYIFKVGSVSRQHLFPSRLSIVRCESSNPQEFKQSEHHDPKEDEAYLKDIKIKILSASIPFIKESGWSHETIGLGAESIGYVSAVHGMFPHGAAHLIHYFTTTCNAELANKMKQSLDQINDKNRLKFLEDSIVSRLEMMNPYRNSWSDALFKIGSSQMAPKHIEAILSLSDDICYYAGDRSVDSHWYLRRGAIAAIYQASELHWLGKDKASSEAALEETREFTANQLKCATALYEMPQLMLALFKTVQNVIPINFNR